MWWKRGMSWACVAASCGWLATCGVARAEDEPKAKSIKPLVKKLVEARVATAVNPGKFWIGLHALPITDEALLSQLKLKERLIVAHVMPDSPAAKSGVKQHDILLKFNDRELATIKDLIEAVNANGEQKATLRVLREGEETSLEVQPSTRPNEQQLNEAREGWLDLDFAVTEGGNAPKELTLRMLGPGIVAAGTAARPFPPGYAVSVSKENDQPAKIVVKKGDTTYEATEGKLDNLPEEIRGPVERLLTGGRFPAVNLAGNRSITLWSSESGDRNQLKEHAEKALEHARLRVREQESVLTTKHLEELRKEFAALREEVQKMREANKADRK